MKLYPKKTKNSITGYFVLIGSKQARDAGFINEDGTTKNVYKIVDAEKQTVTIAIKQEEQR